VVHLTAQREAPTRPSFQRWVVLLTGRMRSVLARLPDGPHRCEPHVTRTGLNTQWVFSGVLRRRLPNRWRFQLLNEKYLTKRRRISGVPPEIRVPFPFLDDIWRGHESALDAALKILGGKERALLRVEEYSDATPEVRLLSRLWGEGCRKAGRGEHRIEASRGSVTIIICKHQ
jgi:hypothetical protein